MADTDNDRRAGFAQAAIDTFRLETGTDEEDVLGDLLCDLRHWAARKGQDFDAMNERGLMHFEAEVEEERADAEGEAEEEERSEE